jgi:uncharacterized protein (DUF58 family)
MNFVERRPSARLLALAVGWVLLVAFAELGALFFSWAGGEMLVHSTRVGWIAIAAAAGLDFRSIRSMQLPEPKRILPRSLSLHRWTQVGFQFNSIPASCDGALLFDEMPVRGEADGLPIRLQANDEGIIRFDYRFRPMQRGDAHFRKPFLVSHSPMGLWRFSARFGEEDQVRVYPNFGAAGRMGALDTESAAAQTGMRRRQRRGEGLEFHQLREYREGDSSRQVDWKATARRQTLISREFEDERDQRVVFLLDCSRRMRARDGDLSHFDHSLNAMVLLAHVALRAGDSVGLLSFGRQRRWLPGKKGVGTVNRLLNTVYDLETSTTASDFVDAASELSLRQPRRALVVLITNLRPEDQEDLVAGVELMRRRHLVMVANLRESKLDDVLRTPAQEFPDALRQVGAWQHAIERAEVVRRLNRKGVLTLDVTPDELSRELVHRYNAIKRAGLL